MALGKDHGATVCSSALVAEYPHIARYIGPDIAGLHLTPMQDESLVAFFRRDRERQTVWTGAHTNSVDGTDAHAVSLRGSVRAHGEIVRGTSAPWKMQEHQIARDIWSILNAAR